MTSLKTRVRPVTAAALALMLILAGPAYHPRAAGQGEIETASETKGVLVLGLDMPAISANQLSQDQLSLLTTVVVDTLAGRPPQVPVDSLDGVAGLNNPVYAALRVGGEMVGSDWASELGTRDAVATAVAAAMEARDAAAVQPVDTVELCLSHSYQAITLDGPGQELLTNAHRGVLGIEFEYDGQNGRYSPTLMLANNWSFDAVIERFANANDLTVEEFERSDVRVRVFGCVQVLVTLGDSSHAVAMERGNTVVRMEDVTEETVGEMRDLLGGWLTGQVHDDGRMTYKYWPSRREESDANNMVRQWMATIALNRLAEQRGDDPAIYDLAARTIRYNLDHFYEEENGLGLILEFDGEVKLGAVALAALAIVTSHDREAFASEEAALRRTVDHLWQEDGSFRTFYRPADRNDNQNFYPGEALVFWAELYAESHDPALLDRIMTSFRYYRGWHLDEANRNPAFVPWHTQAYYLVWRETKEPELRAFIFEMNDWLLDMQQWETAVYPDMRGRFYDPTRPHFGVPHAASTGAYLEGLIDAFHLATETGDTGRAEDYRLAIRRGLRSVMQLQFADDVDLYYVQEPDAVLGGVRETVYDNEIRVDNVQHNLLAVLKAMEIFSSEDFTRPTD